MNTQRQLEIYKGLDQELIELTQSKAHDYASEDVLSNFKQVSKAAEVLQIDITQPCQYALFMMVLKIARLTNLMNTGKVPNNESLQDNWKDLINYGKLAYCNYMEGRE